MNTSLTGRVEAVQRKALNVVDWRFRSPTSSEHPYRSFATSMRRAFPPLPLLLLTLFRFAGSPPLASPPPVVATLPPLASPPSVAASPPLASPPSPSPPSSSPPSSLASPPLLSS